MPNNVQDYQAAQFLINPLTAYGFLEALAVPEGEWILQNAANSVLGKEVGALEGQGMESGFEAGSRGGEL